MPKWFYPACRGCGARSDAGVKISRRGYCADCAIARATGAVRAMATKTGPEHERWVATRGGPNQHGRRTGVGGGPVIPSRSGNDETDTEPV